MEGPLLWRNIRAAAEEKPYRQEVAFSSGKLLAQVKTTADANWRPKGGQLGPRFSAAAANSSLS